MWDNTEQTEEDSDGFPALLDQIKLIAWTILFFCVGAVAWVLLK